MQIHIDVMEDRAGRSYFVVSCEEKGGKVYTRHLTYDQMMEVLSRSGASEKSYYPMGRLPEGYVDAVMDSERGGKVKIYVPPKERVFFLRVQDFEFLCALEKGKQFLERMDKKYGFLKREGDAHEADKAA